jgi:NADPH:quinone reductase-like Zn-dependent oxidoreductase
MRALRLVEFGDPPRFELAKVPDPEPGPGEVVIALRAAALNRRDPWVWTTPGYCPLPVTLGSDGAGVVVAVAADVSAPAVGEEVIFDPTLGWGESEEHPTDAFDILGAPFDGTFAERVIVPAANVAARPERLSWEEAAALNLGGLTAWRATVTCAGAAPGSSVLVTGAGSGVATFATQIAVARGARVYVTSSTEEKLERARSLGAAGGVSYRDADWPQRLRELAGGGLDAAIDSYGGPSWEGALQSLRNGFRPKSRDGLPILGAVPEVEGLYVANGLGENGLTMGPYAGALVSDVANGESVPLDLAPYSPARTALS